MSFKSKKYKLDQVTFLKLMKRQQEADRIRPTAQDWRKAFGMPERTFFNKMSEMEEEK